MTVRTYARAAFVALFLFVTYMTLTPDPKDTEGEMSIARWIATMLFGTAALGDKVAHFLAYATLSSCGALGRLTLFRRRSAFVVALCGWGVVLEVLQGLGGVRIADAADAAANALGAAAGAVAFAAAETARRRLARSA